MTELNQDLKQTGKNLESSLFIRHIVYFIIVRTFDNDIAILTFDSPVVFKSGIQPVCLPSATAGAMEKKFENEGVYITGWGAVKFRGDIIQYTHTPLQCHSVTLAQLSGPTSNTLLQALIQVTEQSYCKEKFKQFSNGNTSHF